MKHIGLIFIIILTLLIAALPITQAQENTVIENTAFRCDVQGHSVFPRYEVQNQRVTLVSWNTGEDIQVLETGFSTSNFDIRAWSDDCRFLLVGLGEVGAQDIIAWNVTENRRIGILENTQGYTISPMWSPDNNYVLLQTLRGGFLWNLVSGSLFQLTSGVDGVSGRNFFSPYWWYYQNPNVTWDMARNQLLAVPMDNTTGVAAYDLNSGAQIAFYHVGDRTGGVAYQLLDNGNQIVVLSSKGPAEQMGMALWNRNTNSVTQLDPEEALGGKVRFAATTRLQFSPDGRYLVVSHRDVYVWDWQNIGASPYEPLYRLETSDMTYPYIRFSDATTLEGVGIRYSWGGFSYYTLYRWDLQTGEQTFEGWGSGGDCYQEEYRASYHEPELLDWACSIIQE